MLRVIRIGVQSPPDPVPAHHRALFQSGIKVLDIAARQRSARTGAS